MSNSFSNRLIKESSPYLLQHAHNPVDWYPWGDEALDLAKQEDKPILVSIGYSACHWCHVMERESFEDEQVAAIMNKDFVNIKIDREERPDLDHIYMDAVQAMSGSGGWPLNVFLTPDAKPFYGGTYFPPRKAFNRPSWTDVLTGISRAWKEEREGLLEQSATLLDHLEKANDLGHTKTGVSYDDALPSEIFANIMKNADTQLGGFGNAPKFPQTFTIQLLLNYYHFSGNKTALDQALLSIDSMLNGGIYDQAGGGFARYSTDAEWLAPHFEKMLYDNALLIGVMADAYRISRNKKYEKAIRQTISFLERELMHKNGGFYAALDADSEGEEGKFYVWTKDEIDNILGDDSALFCGYYDVSEKGNWEGVNILRIAQHDQEYAKANGISVDELETRMDKALQRLMISREKRERPRLDDKILLGWNALMVTALCKAGGALNDPGYRALAVQTLNFIFNKFSDPGKPGYLFHTYKDGVAKYPAFLDDLAYLIQAAMHVQEISGEVVWLSHAKRLTELVIEEFGEAEGYFYFTAAAQKDVVVRKKEVYDGATPSGNSVMAENLARLSVIYNKPEWLERAHLMCNGLSQAIEKYPTSFAIWASFLLERVYGINEIAITGTGSAAARDEFLQQFVPAHILQSSDDKPAGFPLLEGRFEGEGTGLYLCRDYACQAPVETVQELMVAMRKTNE